MPQKNTSPDVNFPPWFNTIRKMNELAGYVGEGETVADLLAKNDDTSTGDAVPFPQVVHDPDSPNQGFLGTGTYSDNPFGANQFVGYEASPWPTPVRTTTQQQQQSKRSK